MRRRRGKCLAYLLKLTRTIQDIVNRADVAQTDHTLTLGVRDHQPCFCAGRLRVRLTLGCGSAIRSQRAGPELALLRLRQTSQIVVAWKVLVLMYVNCVYGVVLEV